MREKFKISVPLFLKQKGKPMSEIPTLKANRLNVVKPSMILGLVQKARQLAAEGHPGYCQVVCSSC